MWSVVEEKAATEAIDKLPPQAAENDTLSPKTKLTVRARPRVELTRAHPVRHAELARASGIPQVHPAVLLWPNWEINGSEAAAS